VQIRGIYDANSDFQWSKKHLSVFSFLFRRFFLKRDFGKGLNVDMCHFGDTSIS